MEQRSAYDMDISQRVSVKNKKRKKKKRKRKAHQVRVRLLVEKEVTFEYPLN